MVYHGASCWGEIDWGQLDDNVLQDMYLVDCCVIVIENTFIY